MKNTADSSSFEDWVIDAAGELAESVSMNRVVAQLYAFLYVSPDAVSLDEMAERLRISKASASVNIRILEEWNAVKKVFVRGSRKDFYTAEADFVKVALDRLEQGLSKRLALADSKLSEARARLPQKGGDDFRKERLRKLSETVALAAKLPGLLSKLRARGGLGLLKAFL
jgi:DNA-binding transcriptional regulator GbsR (MarR family)